MGTAAEKKNFMQEENENKKRLPPYLSLWIECSGTYWLMQYAILGRIEERIESC